MRKLLPVLLISFALAACSSAPTKEQDGARVEDRVPSAEAPAPAPAKPAAPDPAMTKPVKPEKVAVDPLKDPANILSRRSIYFDYDSNVVKDEFRPVVAAHAKYLSQNGSARVRIEGNTDERGSREYNLALGQRRADAVKQMMELLGARGSQIETVSFGKEKPKALGQNEAAWAENRRADIRYQGE
jgi:peptidoglycan-associated lipoprotein